MQIGPLDSPHAHSQSQFQQQQQQPMQQVANSDFRSYQPHGQFDKTDSFVVHDYARSFSLSSSHSLRLCLYLFWCCAHSVDANAAALVDSPLQQAENITPLFHALCSEDSFQPQAYQPAPRCFAEGWFMECKAASSEHYSISSPKGAEALRKACGAFLNSDNGGIAVSGVSDSSHRHPNAFVGALLETRQASCNAASGCVLHSTVACLCPCRRGNELSPEDAVQAVHNALDGLVIAPPQFGRTRASEFVKVKVIWVRRDLFCHLCSYRVCLISWTGSVRWS